MPTQQTKWFPSCAAVSQVLVEMSVEHQVGLPVKVGIVVKKGYQDVSCRKWVVCGSQKLADGNKHGCYVNASQQTKLCRIQAPRLGPFLDKEVCKAILCHVRYGSPKIVKVPRRLELGEGLDRQHECGIGSRALQNVGITEKEWSCKNKSPLHRTGRYKADGDTYFWARAPAAQYWRSNLIPRTSTSSMVPVLAFTRRKTWTPCDAAFFSLCEATAKKTLGLMLPMHRQSISEEVVHTPSPNEPTGTSTNVVRGCEPSPDS